MVMIPKVQLCVCSMQYTMGSGISEKEPFLTSRKCQVHKFDSNIQKYELEKFGYNAYHMGDYLKDFKIIKSYIWK